MGIDITKKEYDKLKKLGYKINLNKKSEIFIKNNIEYKNKVDFLDKIYGDEYATITKDESGFCSFLKDNLCSIYNNKPKVCNDFKSNSKRCKSVRKCII